MQRAKAGAGHSPEDRRLFPRLTVRENLTLPVTSLGLSAERLELVLSLMPVLRGLMDRNAASLSGGQQKLVALARALIVGTKVVLLDEIFEGLSPKMRDGVALIIREYVRTTGASTLLAESNESYVKWADATVYIDRGRVVGGGGGAPSRAPAPSR
jgi:branched-chain amino acid transport system ATP-binding protein